MSSEERRKILQMVSEGKISAEEGATLMRSLEESAEDEQEVIDPVPAMSGERSDAPEFDQVRKRALKFSGAFLWIGILLTVLGAWAMFSVQQNTGVNFWFFCLSLPMFLGILLTVIGAGSRTSRWVYVDVDRTRSHDTDGPRRITIALPLPLGLVSWFLKTFGGSISGLRNKNIEGVLEAIAAARNIMEPLIVHVDNADDGEKIQVYIG